MWRTRAKMEIYYKCCVGYFGLFHVNPHLEKNSFSHKQEQNLILQMLPQTL